MRDNYSVTVVQIGVMLWCLVAWADGPTSRPTVRTGDLTGGARDTGVYVDDSFEGARALASASQLVRAGRHEEAAVQAQTVIETFGDKVGRDAESDTFVSLARLMEREMSQWPAEALAAYQRQFDQAAKAPFERAWRARRIVDLLAVADRFFFTTWGYRAADGASQLAMEQGDLPLAMELYEQRLPRHPLGAQKRGDYLARTAICAALLGWPEVASGAIDRLESIEPPAQTTWPGEGQTDLPEFRRKVFSLRPARASATTSEWPILGGDPSRSRLSPAGIRRRAPLWSSRKFTSDVRLASGETDGDQFTDGVDASLLCFVPVIGEDTVYFCDRWRVWAIDAISGADLWEYGRLSAEALLAGSIPRGHATHGAVYSPTLSDRRVYAVIGGPTRFSFQSSPRRRRARAASLVCLDAATGAVIWKADRDNRGSLFDGLALDTSPVVHRGRLYVVGRYARAAGLGQSCHLMCLDAATGQPIWRTQLASGEAVGFGVKPALPAVAGNSVFVCTNMGVVAAVNATTGRVRWLKIHRREWARLGGWPVPGGMSGPMTPGPAQCSPVLLWKHYVVVSPADDGAIYLFDRATGREEARIDRDSPWRAPCLLGIVEDRLYAATMLEEIVAFSLPSGRREAASDRQDIIGLPLLTRDGVLLTTPNGPIALDLDLRPVPDEQQPYPDLPAGNLVGTANLLVVATADRLHGYASKQAAYDRLQQRIAEQPNEPGPYLALAQMLFRMSPGPDAPEDARGLAAVDRGTEAAGGHAAMGPLAKGRIFQHCLRFVKLVANATPPHPTLAMELARRAQRCIQSKPEHIQYRLTMAEIHEGRRDRAQAIRELHQIVRDAGLRRVLIDQPDAGGSDKTLEAGKVAVRRIEQVIRDFGRDCYANIEREASERLGTALAAGNVDELLHVADAYPNSFAADRALLEAAKRLIAAKAPARAAACLRRARSAAAGKAGSPIDGADLLRLLADAYHAQGRDAIAASYLRQGAVRFPDRHFTSAGKSHSFDSYLLALIPGGAPALSMTPRVGLPGGAEPIVRELAPGDRLLAPEHSFESMGQRGLFVLRTAAGLMAYRGVTNRPVWDAPVAVATGPDDLMLSNDRLFVFRDRHRIYALDRKTGRQAWSVGEAPDEAEQDRDPEEIPTWTRWGVCDSLILACRTRHGRKQRLWGIEVATGEVRWRVDAPIDNADRDYAVCDRWVAYRGYDDANRSVVVTIDARTGEPGPVVPVAMDNRVAIVQFDPVGRLVVLTKLDVACYDPETGAKLWGRNTGGGENTFLMSLDLDAVYHVAKDSGGEWVARKRALETGRDAWTEFARVPIRNTSDVNTLQIDLYADLCIVSTDGAIVAFDRRTGARRWAVTLTGAERFKVRTVAEPYVLALDLAMPEREDRSVTGEYTLKFHDVPREGYHAANLELGTYDPARGIMVLDDCVLLADGQALRIWPCPAKGR